MDAIERLKRQCSQARANRKRVDSAYYWFELDDVEWLLAEVEKRERDLLDLIDRVEKLKNAFVDA